MTTRYLVIAAFAAWALQENHPPVVKIQTPKPNAPFTASTPARYEISVADREDGDSRYDEINPKEVILEIRRAAAIKSSATAAAGGTQSSPLEAPGLAVMARSNCFNCHQFNGKLIGPSLADIARRYKNTTATTDTLSKRIEDGSAGIWGKEKMPSHPEVSRNDIRTMVQWIEKYAAIPTVTYQNGTSGVMEITTPGVYILTAAYTDHGAKDTKAGPWLIGLDQLTITVK